MLKGIDESVVCLPIHDAVAVPKRHQPWAVKTMISTWTEVVGCDVKPRLKVDKAAWSVKAAQSRVADYLRIYVFTSSSFFAASKVMTFKF